tara:strand:+ start:302 stop:406 length:105 start_codon:yes stop_codon:yes gene_type:complete
MMAEYLLQQTASPQLILRKDFCTKKDARAILSRT